MLTAGRKHAAAGDYTGQERVREKPRNERDLSNVWVLGFLLCRLEVPEHWEEVVLFYLSAYLPLSHSSIEPVRLLQALQFLRIVLVFPEW